VILILLIGCLVAFVFRRRIYHETQKFLASDEEYDKNAKNEKENENE